MATIPMFDSLSHPTVSGDWFRRGIDATFPTLIMKMRECSITRACAVGIAEHEGYDHEVFYTQAKKYPQLFPVAGVAPKKGFAIDSELKRLKDIGFRAIKLHSRISGFSFDSAEFSATLRSAGELDLVVFLCTYYHSGLSTYPLADPLFQFVEAARASPKVKVVLLHGGGVELMRWMQLARHEPRLMLDLSYTVMKYLNSSLERDLSWLFDNFSNRTCLGVDHPEFEHVEVRDRFERLSSGKPVEAARRIAGENLAKFLGEDF